MSKNRRAPGPKGNFILGNLLEFNRDVLQMFEHVQKAHGDIIRLRLAHKTAHVLCHPAMAEQALIDQTESIVKYSQANPQTGLALVLGEGLIMSFGELWRRQRALIQPMFHPRIIAELAETMVLCGEQMVGRLRVHAQKQTPVDLWEEARHTALQAAMATLFGASVSEDSSEFGNAITVVLRHCYESGKNPLMPPLSWPTARNRRFHAALKVIDDYVHAVIEQRANQTTRREDFLGLLLEARYDDTGKPMSAKQVRDEAVTMLGAGHETSAAGLTWALVQIARHPDIARKIRDELASVVGAGRLTFAHLRELRYLQAVVQEILRLRAPVPIIPRGVLADTTISGYHIPAGSMLFISVHNIHRHPDFWPNPNAFDPDRFLDDAAAHRPKCSFLPFGAGERFCIGSNFATIELSIFLAQIVGAYDLHLAVPQAPATEVAVTLRPAGPVYARVEAAMPRQPRAAAVVQ